MQPLFRRNSRYLLLMISLLAMCLVSCGGGGGGGEPVSTLQKNSVQSGSVAILLTDGPTDEFSEVNITLTEIELLSDETKVLLFSGEKTLDLLKLRDESYLFAVSTEVPALIYNKIRLQVSDTELVKRDIDRNIIEVFHPKLPGNGKLDLNPRTPFMVEPGGTLILQVDLDAEKSIHIVQTGNSDKYIFRPVVFVDIIDGIFKGNLIRLEGFVNDIDPANKIFLLCRSDTGFQAAAASIDGDYKDASDHPSDNCVTVYVSETTSLFDAHGDSAGFSDLQEGDTVSVIGRFRTADDEMEDGDSLMGFDAEVIEIGGSASFLKLGGMVMSSPDGQGTFAFLLDPGQGIIGTLTVLLQEGTRIFSDSGIALAESDIQAGQPADIHGVLVVSDTGPDLLKAALITLDMSKSPEPMDLEGTASNVDYENRTFELIIPESESACVSVPMDTSIFLVAAEPSTESEGEGSVPFETLEEGDNVRVSGYYDATGCFVTDTIWIQVECDDCVVIE